MAFASDVTLEDLRRLAAAFAQERDWEQYHTPRNLLLAVVSEIGEVAELVRWQGDERPQIPEDKREHWADELADVLILLVRLADVSGVDLPSAFQRKLKAAGEKYPTESFKGSNRKYNEKGS